MLLTDFTPKHYGGRSQGRGKHKLTAYLYHNLRCIIGCPIASNLEAFDGL